MHNLFNAMRAIVERPGYPLLKSYQQDFYEFDQQTLETTWTAESQYLWVVRENGTYLCPIDLDKRANESALACLGQYRDMDIHHIRGERITPVSLIQAKNLIRNTRYEWSPILSNEVLTHGNRFATMVCDIERKPNAIGASVHIGTRSSLTERECADLQWLAMTRAIARAGTLFVGVQALQINGVETIGMRPAAMRAATAHTTKASFAMPAYNPRQPYDVVMA